MSYLCIRIQILHRAWNNGLRSDIFQDHNYNVYYANLNLSCPEKIMPLWYIIINVLIILVNDNRYLFVVCAEISLIFHSLHVQSNVLTRVNDQYTIYVYVCSEHR